MSGVANMLISPGCPLWNEMVLNTNPAIVFAPTSPTEIPNRMTPLLSERLNSLALAVKNIFGKFVSLSVLRGYVVSPPDALNISLHNMGRAVDLSLRNTSLSPSQYLPVLANLATSSKFDWVYYESSSFVHCSVVADSCPRGIDLAFLIDSSGSIEDLFQGGYPGIFRNNVLAFVSSVVANFNIGVEINQTQIGLVAFSSTAQLQFYLNNFTTVTTVQAAVGETPLANGLTATSDGLAMIQNQIFAEGTGARPVALGVGHIL